MEVASGQLVAHSLTLHMATDGGHAKRQERLSQQHAQPVADLGEGQGRRPLLPRWGAPITHCPEIRTNQEGAPVRSHDPIAAPFLVRQGPHGSHMYAAVFWPRLTGYSLAALERPVDVRNHACSISEV